MPRRPTKLIKFLRDVASGTATLADMKKKYGGIVYSYLYSYYVERKDDGTLVLTDKGRQILEQYGADHANA